MVACETLVTIAAWGLGCYRYVPFELLSQYPTVGNPYTNGIA